MSPKLVEISCTYQHIPYFSTLALKMEILRISESPPGRNPDTTLAELHPNSKTQQSKNNTANVVVQQHSRKLLKMDILMPETC